MAFSVDQSRSSLIRNLTVTKTCLSEKYIYLDSSYGVLQIQYSFFLGFSGFTPPVEIIFCFFFFALAASATWALVGGIGGRPGPPFLSWTRTRPLVVCWSFFLAPAGCCCCRTSPISIYSEGMSRLVRKPTIWFPNRSDTNQAVQSQKHARSLKFWI